MALSIKPSPERSAATAKAVREAQKDDTAHLSLHIPQRLHEAMKIQAIREGRPTTLTMLVIRACEDYLKQHAKK